MNTVVELDTGWKLPCPNDAPALGALRASDAHKRELRWLLEHPPGTAVVDHLAAIQAASDEATIRAFTKLHQRRERARLGTPTLGALRASDQQFSRQTHRGSNATTAKLRRCPTPIPLVIQTPHGEALHLKACGARTCPSCGESWAADRQTSHQVIPTEGTLWVLEVARDKRTWDRNRTRITGRGGSARHVPTPAGRLVVTDVKIPDAQPIAAHKAVALLDAAIAAVPDGLRDRTIPKGSRADWIGAWRADHLDRLAETAADHEMPDGHHLVGVLSAEGLTLDRIRDDIEAADGTLVAVSGPDTDLGDVELWRPHQLTLDRWVWLKRKWRFLSVEELATRNTQRAADNEMRASTKRLRARSAA